MPAAKSVPALCLRFPSLCCSGFAGQVADRFSKQDVIRWVKLAEIPISILGFAGFYWQNLNLTLLALLLLSAQSAFFGPAKYGVIPELVAEGNLSQANGFINMFTNLAVIAGSPAAGPISDAYWPADATQPCASVGARRDNGLDCRDGILGLPGDSPAEGGRSDVALQLQSVFNVLGNARQMARSPLSTVAYRVGQFLR